MWIAFSSFRLISQTLRLSACHPSRMLEREFLINIATLKFFNRLGFLRSCNVAYIYIKKSSYFSYFSFEITFSHRRCHRNSLLGWSNSNKNENRHFSLLSYRNVLFCYQRSSLQKKRNLNVIFNDAIKVCCDGGRIQIKLIFFCFMLCLLKRFMLSNF